MKPISPPNGHVKILGAASDRVRFGVGWETHSGCQIFKLVGPHAGWRGGCLWLWKLGLGIEWRTT